MIESRGVPARVAAVVVVVSVAIAVAVAAIGFGAEAGRGAAVGGLVGAVFVATGPWILEPLIRSNPSAALPAAMVLFIGKGMVVVAVLLLLARSDSAQDWLSVRAVALSMLAVVLVALNLQLVDFRNRRVPTYDLGDND
ncbi:hypothetical protein [Aeromicrobium sp. NPDC092404]|uniref:hypothetical protein n=1 Tax=Aeromicrobium sp. NPDC092404 TaxID=3154976 RepID=UPI003423A703